MSVEDEETLMAILKANATKIEDHDIEGEMPKVETELSYIEFLKKLFSSLDVKLSLYFTSHSSAADLDEALKQLSGLMRKKISVNCVLQILYLWPESFKVYETTSGRIFIDHFDYSNLQNLTKRKEEFARRVEKWCRGKQSDEEINHIPVSKIKDTVTDAFNNRVKVLKNSNIRLQKDSRKLDFKERKVDERTNGGKLSLLERIKLKEKQNEQGQESENGGTKKLKNGRDGKLESIYNIIFSLQITHRQKSYTLNNVFQKIKDSYNTNIHEDDILQSLGTLSSLLRNMEIIDVNKMRFLRIGDLNRVEDIKMIKKYMRR